MTHLRTENIRRILSASLFALALASVSGCNPNTAPNTTTSTKNDLGSNGSNGSNGPGGSGGPSGVVPPQGSFDSSGNGSGYGGKPGPGKYYALDSATSCVPAGKTAPTRIKAIVEIKADGSATKYDGCSETNGAPISSMRPCT